MGKTEVFLWGSRTRGEIAEMGDPRTLPIQPYNYHIDGNRLEPLLKTKLAEDHEVILPFYLLLKDYRQEKFTLKTVIRAVANDDGTLRVDMQNLGVVKGWLLTDKETAP